MPQYRMKVKQITPVVGQEYLGLIANVYNTSGVKVGAAQLINKGQNNSFPGTVSPLNTVAPAISGTITSGQVITCSTGTWINTVGITYAYQWFRDGATPIGTAVNTYTLVAGDIGHNVDCRVTATNAAGFSGVAFSNTVSPASLMAAETEEKKK